MKELFLKQINFCIFLFFCFLLPKNPPVDGLLAVVGNNIILHTDVYQQAQIVSMQQGVDPSRTPGLFEKIEVPRSP